MPLVLKLEYYEQALKYLQDEGYRLSRSARLYSYPKHWVTRDGSVDIPYGADNGINSYNRPEDRKIRHFLEREFFYRRKRLGPSYDLHEVPELNQKPEELCQYLRGLGYYYGDSMRVLVAPTTYTNDTEIKLGSEEHKAVDYLCNNHGVAYTTNQAYRT